MLTYHSYEDWGVVPDPNAVVLEAYSGTSVVGWHGQIERQLVDKIGKAEGDRNFDNADKLRQFLKIWRENELTGSINREDLMILKAASDIVAVDDWSYQNYFSSLRDQLRKLIASTEELPLMSPDQQEPPQDVGGGGIGRPPPEFGPEDQAPPGGEEGNPEPAAGDTGGADTDELDKALAKATKSPQGGAGGAPNPGNP